MLEKSRIYVVSSSVNKTYGYVKRQFVERTKMKTGRIIKKIEDRGFGFILAGDKAYFFHSSQCETDFTYLVEGDNVQFNIEDSPKELRAINVGPLVES